MSDYPAGAEFDGSAPYNEDLENIKECLECNEEILFGDFCNPCEVYLSTENKKEQIITGLQQLVDISSTLDNTCYVNKLNKIIKQVKDI